jgi:hypothetical protein
MNPLLYKAHPLLYLTVDLLVNPAAHSSRELGRVVLAYLAANLVFAPTLCWGARKAVGAAPSLILAYVLTLPAVLMYFAPMMTLLGDVIAQTFQLADRFILVFCVIVASQMLSVFYALILRQPTGEPLGLSDGMALSLLLWLVSLPVGLAGLWLNAEFKLI